MSATTNLTPLFDAIAAHGNKGVNYEQTRPNVIVCEDGFRISVIAGRGCYCSPRPDWPFDDIGASADFSGPYNEVECGFPSERPEPWEAWEERAEQADDPTETVYSYVPVQLVRDLLVAHGGEKAGAR